MNSLPKYLNIVFSGAMLLSLSIYAPIPAQAKINQSNLFYRQTNNKLTDSRYIRQLWANSTVKNQKKVTITIYKADSQCLNFVTQKLVFPAQNSLQAVVKKILDQRDSADFSVAGYRVSVNAKTRIATVDMRLAPNSKRKFVSLSTCEQFALFGSLRKTLISNSVWKIKDVRFTEQGKDIYI